MLIPAVQQSDSDTPHIYILFHYGIAAAAAKSLQTRLKWLSSSRSSMLLVSGIVFIAFVQSYHSSIEGLGPQGLISRKVYGLDE